MPKIYTDAQIEEKVRKLKKYIERTGKVPAKRELVKLGFPSVTVFARKYGSYSKLIESLGFTPNKKRYTKEELIQILKNYKEETGKVPTMNEFRNNPSYPSPTSYTNCFGSWNKALEEAGMNLSHAYHEYCDLLIQYRKDREGILSPRTLQTYTATIADFKNFLESKGKDWEDLTANDIVEYFTHLKNHGSFSSCTKLTKPNSPVALKSKARFISAFLTWIEKWCKRKNINPPVVNSAEIEEIKETLKRSQVVPPVPENEPRALTMEEIEQIRGEIDNPIVRNIFDIGLNLGLRVSEYKKITMDMVLGSEEERRPRLNGSEPIPRFEREHYIEVSGKGNKIRKVVLTEEMKVLIKKQLLLRQLHRVEHDGFFFSIGKLKKGKLHIWKVHELYKKLREKSGVDFTAHNLRHTMSVQFQRRGIEQSLVKQRLGHSGSVTQRYSRAQILDRYQLFQEKVGII